jgi:hypothetical protein
MVSHRLVGVAAALAVAFGLPVGSAAPPAGPSASDARQIDRDLSALGDTLRGLRQKATTPDREDLIADAEVFHKGVVWALRYEPADVALVKRALARGAERAAALAGGKAPWADRKGKLVRGYVSAVDGSVQPFGLIIPTGYVPKRPARLDVVLHGSTTPVGASELQFIGRFDEGDAAAETRPDRTFRANGSVQTACRKRPGKWGQSRATTSPPARVASAGRMASAS